MNHNDILALIDEQRLFEAFDELDNLGTKSPIYAQLKQEYQSGNYRFDFYDRLKVFINSLKTKNTAPEIVNNSQGNGNIFIQNIQNTQNAHITVGNKEAEKPKKTILFLSANPKDTAALDFEQEYRGIIEEMRAGKQRDDYEWLLPVLAATNKELMRALSQHPQVVHFSGHGETQGLYLVNSAGYSQLLSTEVLELLMEELRGTTECVLLNACYSAAQAQVISRLGCYVIGYNLPIGDSAAITFAKGFYLGLGEGKDYVAAAKYGKVMLMMEHSRSELLLEVWKDGELVKS